MAFPGPDKSGWGQALVSFGWFRQAGMLDM